MTPTEAEIVGWLRAEQETLRQQVASKQMPVAVWSTTKYIADIIESGVWRKHLPTSEKDL